ARADRGGVATAVSIDGRTVRLALRGESEAACALAASLAAERERARWTAADAARTRDWPLGRLAPTRAVIDQALAARAALGGGEAAPFDASDVPVATGPAGTPGRRTEDAPAVGDGRGRLVMAWALSDDDVPLASAVAADLGHPGGPVAGRLLDAHGAADAFAVTVTSDPAALVVSIVTSDTKAARDRILRELEAFEIDPRPDAFVASGQALDAVTLERFVRRLPRVPASELVQAAPANTDNIAADTDAVLLFVRASIDLRCPAPGELRDSATLLEEKHGLDASRYLALSRALGRDSERFQEIDLEVRDRCAERSKLARMLAPQKVVALYKAVRCAPNDAERERALRRGDVDASALRPLVALVRDEPRWSRAIDDIEAQCPERAP
ncbi:MAG: hypothetical protein U1F43_30950, partial [Myxococcota bacterium]